MIKQTLYFGNQAYLSKKNEQLIVSIRQEGKLTKKIERPIEDIGMVILDHPQITLTHQLLVALQANKTVIMSCDEKHLPHSVMLPMVGHSEQSKRYRIQQSASQPLKKNLWAQTIRAKLRNQAIVLEQLNLPSNRINVLIKRIQSGDPDNIEGQAAAYYWSHLFDDFTRSRDGEGPNALLNYGYAIIRAMVARALLSSGLHTSFGIHHRNKYNPHCLADDIMEPFRPFVDIIVHNLYTIQKVESFLDTTTKQRLLSLIQQDGKWGNQIRPLLVGVSQTTATLFDCYEGKKKKIVYPVMLKEK